MNAVTLVRRIAARRSIVFDAFVTPEGLTSWWGPDEFPVISASADVRVGGHFRVRFNTADGRTHECSGEFLEVVQPERLIMSWRWTEGGVSTELPEEQGNVSRVELHLRVIDTGTELTLIHGALRSAASVSSHTYGWEGALRKLPRIFT
jgi:uncharacterized protein YndB with AHSA1/START domain